jgi:hypothetical protein
MSLVLCVYSHLPAAPSSPWDWGQENGPEEETSTTSVTKSFISEAEISCHCLHP